MSKHTPGPWTHRNGRIFQTDRPELTIANVARAFDGDYSPANGDVLAASAELLEALKALTRSLDEHDLLHDDQREAFAASLKAIAKATGEQS